MQSNEKNPFSLLLEMLKVKFENVKNKNSCKISIYNYVIGKIIL